MDCNHILQPHLTNYKSIGFKLERSSLVTNTERNGQDSNMLKFRSGTCIVTISFLVSLKCQLGYQIVISSPAPKNHPYYPRSHKKFPVTQWAGHNKLSLNLLLVFQNQHHEKCNICNVSLATHCPGDFLNSYSN